MRKNVKPIHIICDPKDIAENVIIAGDPKRTEYYAKKFLTRCKLVSDIRHACVYTGYYKGKRFTLATAGMGIPSMGIYSYELYHFYGVKQIIRVGTCGVIDPSIKVRDIVVADAAYSISSFNESFGKTKDRLFYPSRKLSNKIYSLADKEHAKKGTIYTSDVFDMYVNINDILKAIPKDIHVVVSEMEAAGLFLVAKKLNKKAACIVTVTDSKFEPNNFLTSMERQNTLDNMLLLALEASLD